MKKSRLLGAGFACAYMLVATVVNAEVVLPAVTVVEQFNTGNGQGSFTVINNSGQDVFGFLVANDTAVNADIALGDPNLSNWGSRIFTRQEWEGFNALFSFPNGNDFNSSVLNWDDFFLGYTQVIGYWNDIEIGSTLQPIAAGITQSGFEFEAGLEGSPFLALTGDGSVLFSADTSSTVPIPAAIWLFGTGLLGLVGISRRNKAA